MNISLTPAAVRRIQSQLTQRGRGIGLRVGVKKSGCSGYAYLIEYADNLNKDDVIINSGGIKVVVAKAQLPLLDGLEIDFQRNGLNESFHFSNPNATAQCGCGESFAI